MKYLKTSFVKYVLCHLFAGVIMYGTEADRLSPAESQDDFNEFQFGEKSIRMGKH